MAEATRLTITLASSWYKRLMRVRRTIAKQHPAGSVTLQYTIAEVLAAGLPIVEEELQAAGKLPRTKKKPRRRKTLATKKPTT